MRHTSSISRPLISEQPHPAAGGRWFEALAQHTGAAYLRYSFTKGTAQEVGFLVDHLGLRAGQRILDVGCGPGRHVRALAELGIDAVGLDISVDFLRIAGGRADSRGSESSRGSWVRGDARCLPFTSESFDAAFSLCQGGFGLLGGVGDLAVMEEMARVVRPGGRIGLSAFSAYFAVCHLEQGDTFDASAGVNHETATVRNEAGREAPFDLWTTCFTPRELRLMASACGLQVDALYAVEPGRYAANPPDLDHPEWLLLATREPERSRPRSV